MKSSMLTDLPLSTAGKDRAQDGGGMEGGIGREFEGRLRGPPLLGGHLEGRFGEEAEGFGGCRGGEEQEQEGGVQEGGGQEEGGHTATASEAPSTTAFM